MDKLQKKELKRDEFKRVNHILPQYCNPEKIRHLPGADEAYRISYDEQGRKISIEEVISHDSGRHTLELTSLSFVLDGHIEHVNEKRESAIHHHPKEGHQGYHLQFTIRLDRTRKIRIFLEHLDKEGYLRSVRGFLRITKEIIANECERDKLPDLTTYFFNEHIDELEPDKL
jgi:hypothetical protein